jgi:hypothetical protein
MTFTPKRFQTVAPRPADVDVSLSRLAADIRATVARQKFEQRMAPLKASLAHPESPMPSRPISPGERAEFSHLLHDQDADSTEPPLPYSIPLEAS